MAFSEADRVQIRKYLGAGSLYLQLFPKLENAITVVQSIADGGARPDSSTENEVKLYVTKLATIESNLEALWCQAQVVQAGKDEVTLDVKGGIRNLRNEGRRLVGVISRILAVAPVWDYFSAQQPSADDSYNPYTPM